MKIAQRFYKAAGKEMLMYINSRYSTDEDPAMKGIR